MRKIKKINGYLVVRFNDREKRAHEGTGLGSYGVIDAELYTGNLEIDRSEMEYDDAETLEIAVEQARGLEAELDVEEPEVKVTVTVESETEARVTEADPENLFQEEKIWLGEQIKDRRRGDLTPDTAAHQLTGYARALKDLGIINSLDERFMVAPDTFGPIAAPASPVRTPDDIAAQICDGTCKHRVLALSQEELDEICEDCPVNRLTASVPPPRDGFKNLPWERLNDPLNLQVYLLGATLDQECPDNDCIVYRNIFRMARELDTALDGLTGYAAEVLRRELRENVWELCQMYRDNYAVRKYREGFLNGQAVFDSAETGKEETEPYRCPRMTELSSLMKEWQQKNSAPWSALKICVNAFLAEEKKAMLTFHPFSRGQKESSLEPY